MSVEQWSIFDIESCMLHANVLLLSDIRPRYSEAHGRASESLSQYKDTYNGPQSLQEENAR